MCFECGGGAVLGVRVRGGAALGKDDAVLTCGIISTQVDMVILRLRTAVGERISTMHAALLEHDREGRGEIDVAGLHAALLSIACPLSMVECEALVHTLEWGNGKLRHATLLDVLQKPHDIRSTMRHRGDNTAEMSQHTANYQQDNTVYSHIESQAVINIYPGVPCLP